MTLGKGFYRFLGIVAAITAIVQSSIWIILALFGIICYYADCGALPNFTPFGRAFNHIYLNTDENVNSPCIDPVYFHVIMWLYLFISIVWVLTSAYLLFCVWKNSKKHKYSGPMWIVYTLFVCAVDVIIFAIFTVDYHRSLNTNFKMHQSSLERSNIDCIFRRMYNFDNPKGEYTPEERAMIELSIGNERARLREKIKTLERLSETLNDFFIAHKRNPLILPPNFTTPASSVRGLAAAATNTFDFGDDSDDLEGQPPPPPPPGPPDSLGGRFRMCNRRSTKISAQFMLAPSATMMTLAIRGYILWVFNVCMAFALWHFYVYKRRESFLRRFSM